MKSLITIAGLTLALTATGPRAQGGHMTEGELAMLPLFCRDVLGMPKTNYTPGFNHWIAQVGEGFRTMHHYCWARTNIRRIYAPGSDRTFLMGRLTQVVNDLFYVIKYSPADFVMLPEIYSSLAEVELLRKDPAAAYGHIQSAQRLKPSYAPPFRVWGDYLASVGKRNEAKEWFKAGLEFNPQDRGLLERYRALGGDPASIVARPAAASEVASRGGESAASQPEASLPAGTAASASPASP